MYRLHFEHIAGGHAHAGDARSHRSQVVLEKGYVDVRTKDSGTQ